MVRRFALASLVVVSFAFAGASAGPVRLLQSLQLVDSFAQLKAPDKVEQETRPLAPRVPVLSDTAASRPPRSVGFRRFPVERWLFQRPPPALI